MASPYIRHFHSQEEMEALLRDNSVVVVSFHASWSAPCRNIAPFYTRLAATHRSLTFVKVEIDEDNIGSVGQKARLIMLPTFIMIKDEKEIDRIRGPDRKGLEDMIVKHVPEAEPIAGDSGSTYVIAAGDESPLEFLDMQNVNCLNETQDHPLKSIVERKALNTTEAYLESDADEQLLITLPFNQEVKVRFVILYTKDPKFGPKKIKIDINKPALGFDDVDSATEPAVTQVLEVPEEVVKEGKAIHLRFVRLQRVNSLHIFVESNHGNEEVTRIDAIDVYGPGFSEPPPTAQIIGLRDFYGTHERGIEFIRLFQLVGGDQNLSNAVALLRESALLCPAGHQHRAMLVGNLAGAIRSRYQHRGDYSDLSEAITLFNETLELHPPGHSDRATWLSNLGNALCIRYEREGSLPDLEEAIERQREALNLCPPDHPDRTAFLTSLGNALCNRYQCDGSLLDLEEAVEKHREVLSLLPPGHPECAGYLSNLGNALCIWYEREGSLPDLEEAIEKYREALNLRPPDHPDRAASLCNLGTALSYRYQCDGSLPGLEETIERHRESLSLRPPGHPDRPLSLSSLGKALRDRYEHEGSLPDLEEATENHRESLNLLPSGHPYRARSLTNLGHTLCKRYQRDGSLPDLEETIEKHREALNLCPPGHPHRAGPLNSLAVSVGIRYEREGSLPDLEEAIEKCREALNLHPPGHPDNTGSLTNLGNALSHRYQREGSLPDLEEAIEQYREALNLCPPGHLDHAGPLSNLAGSTVIRYKREGSLPDLEEAIEKYREALNLRPPGHPDLAGSFSNLASALSTRYKCERSLPDLEESIERYQEALNLHPIGHPDRSSSLLALSHVSLLMINKKDDSSIMHEHQTLVDDVLIMLREAVNHSNSSPQIRLQAALTWIDASTSMAPASVLEAYNAALGQLDIVLATSSTLASKHFQLSSKELARCKRLGVEAASCAVRQGDTIRAIEFLEQGRNLLFAQVGRYRVELDELRKENVELAKRFFDLSSLLDSSVVSNQPTLEGRTAFEDPTARYRRVASDWDRTVNDIRAVPGFHNFLRPPHYAALRAVATEGPIVIVIPDAGQSYALIVLQGRDTPHYVDLPKVGEVELVALCDDFIGAVQSNDGDDADNRMTIVLRELWVLVVRPIADALENELRCPLHSRIWWCPASYISILPLHAAGRYTSNTDPNQNFPARYVSSYTPTLQALGRAQSKHSDRQGESMLIVAQPDTPGQGRLPNTIPESEVVKTLAEAKMKMKTTLLSSKEGTRAAVLNCMVDHSWVHLTCHGSQNFGNPFDSCFCLYDNQLTLRDIIQRGLPNADFAFLAACHTATGDNKLLDEGLHLAAGLQFAGFRSVVGTIWEVADIDGPVIAKAFYEALQPEGVGEEGVDCRGAAYALSKAVKDLRDRGVPLSRWIRHIHIGI